MIIVFHLGVWSPYPINVAHYLLDNLHFSIEEKDKYGFSPLALSSYFNGLENVEYLVNRSANIQTIDFCGRTPLHLAALRGNLVIFDYILYLSVIRLKVNITLTKTNFGSLVKGTTIIIICNSASSES